MGWRLWTCALVAGCAATAPVELRVEPSSIDLSVTLATPTTVALEVRALDAGGGAIDVTADAKFDLDRPTLGTITDAGFVSDGIGGGTGTIIVTYDGLTASVPVTTHIHNVRVVDGTPFGAADLFAAAKPVAYDASLEPGEGAVLPPNLQHLDLDFASYSGDDAHEVTIASPYLDLRVFAPGVPGPRHIELSTDEWSAIVRTHRGDSVDLAVYCLEMSAPNLAPFATARVAIADVDLGSLVFSGMSVDPATGKIGTDAPSIWRYTPARAKPEVYAAAPANWGCLGCHVAVSSEGSRIAGAGASPGNALAGWIVDTSTRAVIANYTAEPWTEANFDPSGALVTSYQTEGVLKLRDGLTGVTRATIATELAVSPAVSPDGHSLAYVAIDAPGNAPNSIGLRVRPWNAATGAVGAATEVATGAGLGIPEFSSDGAWIVYVANGVTTGQMHVVRADGSAPAIDLGIVGIPRWASPVMRTSSGVSMAWIAYGAPPPLVPSAQVGYQRQLWLVPFYPERNAIGRPVHLPGQPANLSALMPASRLVE